MTAASAAALLIVGAVIGFVLGMYVGIFAAVATPACATIWQRYRKQAESRKRLRVAVGEIRKVIASQAAARNICTCDTCTGERIAREVLRAE